ncbi:MAG: ribokinase [Candidatus Hodarchaeota archaeon]
MVKGKVCVFGSFIVDLMMRAPKLPGPGETIKGTIFKIGPGGKGSNQGVAAHRAGASTTMITKIGNDEFASLALNSFKGEGIDTDYVFEDSEAATGAALIMVDEKSGENMIIVTLGACETFTDEEVDSVKEVIIDSDIFLTQFETNFDAMERAIKIAHDNGIPVILNPAPADHISDHVLSMVNYLTPNESEASILCGFSIQTEEDMTKAGKILLEKGVKSVIFTIGEKGAFLVNKKQQKMFPAFKVDVVDTTGAGDAFNGGLATALAEGMPLNEAITFANAVGALNVTKIGTAPAMPTREEIDRLISNRGL